MIESRNELDLAGQQHAVAKYVTRHVADSCDSKWIFLSVDAKLTKMTFDRFPRTQCRNTHFLVVVAGRST